jgi:phosphate starvation-inducible protein PhoH
MSAPPKKRLSRKEKRQIRDNNGDYNNPTNIGEKLNFTLKPIVPLTVNQQNTFNAYNNKHLLLIGSAGTGKSFLSIYLGMNTILNNKDQKKLIIVRSVVSSRDVGFLPGSNKEKSKVYEAPYYGIFSELFGRADAYEYLKNKGIVEFMNTSFIRGITLNDAVIVIDETQNLTWHEISSVFTRIGNNCKVIFSGDTKQNDLHAKRETESSGINNLIHVLSKMNEFKTIEFTSKDIVRSDLIKSFIITCEKLGY